MTNDQIKASEVRLVGAEGEQLGILSITEAQKIADSETLDLVLMTASATPPVCKLMNYGKYKYEQTKKEKELKKNQKIVEMKEIQLSLTIDKNDIAYRIKQGQKFLGEGNKVKITLRMKGRQQAFVTNAISVVKNFAEQLQEFGALDKDPEVNGRNIIVVVNPKIK